MNARRAAAGGAAGELRVGVEAATDPAGGPVAGGARPVRAGGGLVPGGVPDVHGGEVRPVGVGVADALDDAELSGLEELGEAVHCRVEADVVVDPADPLLPDADGRTAFAVDVVG